MAALFAGEPDDERLARLRARSHLPARWRAGGVRGAGGAGAAPPQGKLNQLIRRDRQIAHALAGRVIDRVGDRRGRSDYSDLTHALDAERVDDLVRLVDEDHLDVVHIRV